MEKKNMYIVIKTEDALKYLSDTDLKMLDNMMDKICNGRKNDYKPAFNTYYVCNTDEPYAKDVHNLIINGDAKKNNYNISKGCFDACGSGYNKIFTK